MKTCIEKQVQKNGQLVSRLQHLCEEKLRYFTQKLKTQEECLHHYDPCNIFKKGLCMVKKNNDAILNSVNQIEKYETIRVRLQDGILYALVKDVIRTEV